MTWRSPAKLLPLACVVLILAGCGGSEIGAGRQPTACVTIPPGDPAQLCGQPTPYVPPTPCLIHQAGYADRDCGYPAPPPAQDGMVRACGSLNGLLGYSHLLSPPGGSGYWVCDVLYHDPDTLGQATLNQDGSLDLKQEAVTGTACAAAKAAHSDWPITFHLDSGICQQPDGPWPTSAPSTPPTASPQS